MDLFILLVAGLLGSVFVMSGIGGQAVSSFWKAVFGVAGGAAAYFCLRYIGFLPDDPSISLLMILFVTGGFAGGLSILVFVFARQVFQK